MHIRSTVTWGLRGACGAEGSMRGGKAGRPLASSGVCRQDLCWVAGLGGWSGSWGCRDGVSRGALPAHGAPQGQYGVVKGSN